MRDHITYRKAFTLPEVIVAFGVLVMVIISSTDLMVSIIRSNTNNVNTLIAYGLAQEGLEAIRNVRDSNWLLGANFQGQVGNTCLWSYCLPGAGVMDYYTISPVIKNVSGANGNNLTDVQTYAPWQLGPATGPDGYLAADKIKLYETKLTSDQTVWYEHCTQPCTLTPSLFSRYLEITPEIYSNASGKTMKYLVSSVVKWSEQGRDKEVRLTTELTDWKSG